MTPDYPDVPNWRDARTGTTAAWREFAEIHGIRHSPSSTRGRIIANVQAWLARRDEAATPGLDHRHTSENA